MRTLFLLLNSLVIVCCTVNEPPTIIENIESTTILSSLFLGALQSDNTIKLALNHNDSIYTESYDNHIHIVLDTVILYQYNNVEYAYAVVNNPVYNSKGQSTDCHSCAPLVEVFTFVKQDSTWQLEQSRGIQERHGQYGEVGTFDFVCLGSDLPTIVFDTGEYTSQGYTSAFRTCYSLVRQDKFKKIFEYQYISDSTGAYGNDGKAERTEMSLLSDKNYSDITLTIVDSLNFSESTYFFKFDINKREYYLP